MKRIKFNGIALFLFFITKVLFSVMEFGYKFTPEKDILFITKDNNFLVQPQSIMSHGNMLYFAAQDFTKNRELLVKRVKEIKVIKDEPKRKIIKATYSLGSDKEYPEYSLILFLEIREEFPFLAICSKFVYNGEGTSECGINWAMENAYEPYKYYTIPEKGKIATYKLEKTRKTKIGQANWIFGNTGKGEGGGLIAPAVILGKGESFIFINSVPPKKKLSKNESIDVFMIFMPINKNFKILEELFLKIKDIKWEYEKF
ncbi:MAG: hypothetical protein NC827_06495 [Candidatus Omnitrophica bacterium]|nr:hypothetical protein [Candidatus Omnitrophota bacterium]MCM8802939.1 hypothetical protein [Candidatus Omnitrophota bacterium]